MEADGSHLRGLAVGELGASVFSMFLGPAAAGLWAWDAHVLRAGGGGQPSAGGIESGQEP